MKEVANSAMVMFSARGFEINIGLNGHEASQARLILASAALTSATVFPGMADVTGWCKDGARGALDVDDAAHI